MAIINVSSSTSLQTALRGAKAGDEIRLAGGEYNLSMQNLSFSGEVTITSASAGSAAVFSNINLTRASNLTFEGVDLKADAGAEKPFVIRESSNITIRDALIDGATEGGYGDGHGLWVAYSDGFTLENTDVRDFNIAGYFLGSDDLAIRNNSFDNIAMDTLILGRVHGVQIANNVIDMNVKGGTKHTDAIQFWNTDDNDPSSNVTISGNTIRTNNEASHGIYAANGLTQAGGGTDTHFSNFEIRNNVVISAQMSAIAIGHANGVDITGNTVLQDTEFRSTSEIRTPIIAVMADSTTSPSPATPPTRPRGPPARTGRRSTAASPAAGTSRTTRSSRSAPQRRTPRASRARPTMTMSRRRARRPPRRRMTG